jgi:hypothetical protein
MLKVNHTLEHIDLSSNYLYNVYGFGAEYAAIIAAALFYNTAISRLTFDGGSSCSRGTRHDTQ